MKGEQYKPRMNADYSNLKNQPRLTVVFPILIRVCSRKSAADLFLLK